MSAWQALRWSEAPSRLGEQPPLGSCPEWLALCGGRCARREAALNVPDSRMRCNFWPDFSRAGYRFVEVMAAAASAHRVHDEGQPSWAAMQQRPTLKPRPATASARLLISRAVSSMSTLISIDTLRRQIDRNVCPLRLLRPHPGIRAQTPTVTNNDAVEPTCKCWQYIAVSCIWQIFNDNTKEARFRGRQACVSAIPALQSLLACCAGPRLRGHLCLLSSEQCLGQREQVWAGRQQARPAALHSLKPIHRVQQHEAQQAVRLRQRQSNSARDAYTHRK